MKQSLYDVGCLPEAKWLLLIAFKFEPHNQTMIQAQKGYLHPKIEEK